MKVQISLKNILVYACILAVGAFILSSRCSYRHEIDKLNADLFTKDQTILTKDAMISSQRIKISTVEAQVVSSQSAIKKLEGEKEYLKALHISDLKSITNLNITIDVLKKQGTYRDTVIISDTIYGGDTLRYVDWADEWAYAHVYLYPKSPVIDLGLKATPIKLHIYYEGILNPKPKASVSTANPYIKINSANTVIVEDKKFLQKKYPYAIAGFIAGWLLLK